MSKLSRCAQLLTSGELQPFWDEVSRVEKACMNDLRSTRDASYCRGLDALDRIKQIPDLLARTAAKDEKNIESG